MLPDRAWEHGNHLQHELNKTLEGIPYPIIENDGDDRDGDHDHGGDFADDDHGQHHGEGREVLGNIRETNSKAGSRQRPSMYTGGSARIYHDLPEQAEETMNISCRPEARRGRILTTSSGQRLPDGSP